MADESTIIRILNEISENESDEENDNLEVELIDDSDEDPDYVPREQNLITDEEISEIIRSLENPPIPPAVCRKRKHVSTSITSNISTSKTDDNSGQISREYDSNKYKITIPNTSKIVGKNGFEWKTECERSRGKVSQKNIVHIRPGPSPLAIN